ncbi:MULTISPECIES: NADH-quinone oxidoreductase subunit C [Micromonospora]|uniref:NADH-quinone oxidoreductase subunit D n=1 Tax=Micromonospora solifontis TaxID=2487138 RepID=A0ABX9WC11_9ACTN|nr:MULTISPECIES: NADH-quinone oxidoreductase subunit C [Micromonospora]NES17008.1 NADH-quinone oxidoreductase subunit D [Micromonospora sp. PPF5-17B]NES38421.1 NADH-quinone oxidoreductase subunit D [Micromonospora solifontis]NES58711.1 NADH-quinone oxidoreductase subunit D [Micromonospora sp. PPF5-6]RNL95836.1 NADH-quinone oxidoreductase subunit D [Micromonospora solifontis]
MTTSWTETSPTALAERLRAGRDAGRRFAGLYATAVDASHLRLTALMATPGGGIDAVDALAPAARYPALTPRLPAAFWYERVIHDLFGTIPDGHPRLDPLILPLPDDATRPRPGGAPCPAALDPDDHVLARRVLGTGLCTIPHGPVRSGVMESVEYLVETPGEDIPHLQIRPYYKHRGVEKRFEGLDLAGGLLVAERVEGVATVAHALAYAHAVEALCGVPVPPAAGLIRVLHAELERIANHLDVVLRLCDAAGLGVAVARFGWHKERILRLVGRLCGSRFGRGVVIPGGVSGPPRLSHTALGAELDRIRAALDPDLRLLLVTSSFLDRLRGTGPLPPARADEHGALGPVGRASGCRDDDRVSRGYDAYPLLGPAMVDDVDTGDALARLRVRVREIDESFRLIRAAADRLDTTGPLAAPCTPDDGRGIGWAEAAQGEVLYAVHVTGGRITRCAPRSASFHNLALFGEVFTGDILTDFPFVEASFGLSIAGVAL